MRERERERDCILYFNYALIRISHSYQHYNKNSFVKLYLISIKFNRVSDTLIY